MYITRKFRNSNKTRRKNYFFTCLYRSPSQIHNKTEGFCRNLDFLLSNINDLNPYFSVLTGDFNAS